MRSLKCVACGQRDETGTAKGWRAPLVVHVDESKSVAVFCPMCAFDFGLATAPRQEGEADA